MFRLRYTFLALLLSMAVWAENGHSLWLRMTEGNNTQVTGPACTATDELRKFWKGGELELFKAKGYDPEAFTIACQDGKTTVSASTMPSSITSQKRFSAGWLRGTRTMWKASIPVP